VVWLPSHISLLSALHSRSEREGALYSDLRAAGEAPAVRAAFSRCAPLSAADHRPVPYIRWWLDGDAGTVNTVERGSARLGRLLLVPRRTYLATRFYQENFPRISAPAGWRLLYGNRSWRVYAAPTCA
jgi:hypothetical protein